MTALATILVRPRISWWQVIVDLERAGFYHGRIAAAIGARRTTILGWKNNDAAPRYEDGERLIALWRVATGLPEEQVPRKPRE